MEVIREATLADAIAIAKVQVDSWRSTYAGIVPLDFLDALSYEQRATCWGAILSGATGGHFVYVAEDHGGNVVGFASGGQRESGDLAYDGELFAIYLLESHQHLGLGRLLASKIASRLLEADIVTMLVWVLALNPSRAFYESLGATQISERDIIIGGTKFLEVAYGWADLDILTYLSG